MKYFYRNIVHPVYERGFCSVRESGRAQIILIYIMPIPLVHPLVFTLAGATHAQPTVPMLPITKVNTHSHNQI